MAPRICAAIKVCPRGIRPFTRCKQPALETALYCEACNANPIRVLVMQELLGAQWDNKQDQLIEGNPELVPVKAKKSNKWDKLADLIPEMKGVDAVLKADQDNTPNVVETEGELTAKPNLGRNPRPRRQMTETDPIQRDELTDMFWWLS